jgi:hypothetical protein
MQKEQTRNNQKYFLFYVQLQLGRKKTHFFDNFLLGQIKRGLGKADFFLIFIY